VRTLDGRSLGYIPRDRTLLFQQDLCFGHVQSAGRQGEEGLWGFNIVAQPTVPPVEVHAWPAALRPHLHLSGQVGALLELRERNPAATSHAATLLQQLNSWSPADTQLYLGHVADVAAARSRQQGWRLDLQWLQERGVVLPPPLEALSRSA
ncbi:hypothetical protein COHA_010814, partial [Chlorella ohadii]